jgi:hypothetical protein
MSSKVFARGSRLKVRWFQEWHADLDAALAALPSMETCPHDLYRELMLTRGPVEKRIGLILQRDEPIAVVGLRRDGTHWAPVTNWVVPGALFPVADGRVVDALTHVGLPLFVAWWRHPGPPPESSQFEGLESIPTRKLTCTGDFEDYWRSSGLLRDIRRARKKCERLAVVVNAPGAADWTLTNWGRRWAPSGQAEVPDTCDRRAVARYWEPRGRQYTISLLDGDTFAASAVVFAHGREIVGQANYREPAYDKLGVGARILDATHQWAVGEGIEKHDFGGGHDYKSNWAPHDGERWQFRVPGQRSAWDAVGALWNRARS